MDQSPRGLRSGKNLLLVLVVLLVTFLGSWWLLNRSESPVVPTIDVANEPSDPDFEMPFGHLTFLADPIRDNLAEGEGEEVSGGMMDEEGNVGEDVEVVEESETQQTGSWVYQYNVRNKQQFPVSVDGYQSFTRSDDANGYYAVAERADGTFLISSASPEPLAPVRGENHQIASNADGTLVAVGLGGGTPSVTFYDEEGTEIGAVSGAFSPLLIEGNTFAYLTKDGVYRYEAGKSTVLVSDLTLSGTEQLLLSEDRYSLMIADTENNRVSIYGAAESEPETSAESDESATDEQRFPEAFALERTHEADFDFTDALATPDTSNYALLTAVDGVATLRIFSVYEEGVKASVALPGVVPESVRLISWDTARFAPKEPVPEIIYVDDVPSVIVNDEAAAPTTSAE